MEESGDFLMLIGEHHHNIDEKCRLVVPVKFRDELGKEFIVTRGLDKCLYVYSMPEWNLIVNKLKTLPFTHKDARNFTRFFLSGAAFSELDRSGRVSLTSPLIEYAGITKECVSIGANDHIEIWSKERWEKFLTENEENLSDIAENLFTTGNFNAL